MEDNNHADTAPEQKQNNRPKSFHCQHCNQPLRTRSCLYWHMKRFHPELIKNPHRCHVCQTVFPYSSALKRHVQEAHSNARPHSCPKCARKYKSVAYIKRHLKTHDVSRETFKCNNCERELLSKNGLEFHLKTAHGSQNTEGNTQSDNSPDISKTYSDEENNHGNVNAGIVETPSKVLDQNDHNGLITVDQHASLGLYWNGWETTENQFPLGRWDYHCFNMYASQDHLQKHCNQDHTPDGRIRRAETGNASVQFSQGVSTSFPSAQQKFSTASWPTPGPNNAYSSWSYNT